MFSTDAYKRLFFSGVVNGIGDRFSQVATLSLLLSLTGSGLAVGAALAIRIIPFLILAPVGGYLADHFHKGKLMVVTDVARVPLALSFLFVNGKEELWIIYTALFLLACGQAIYEPVRKSGIGELVPTKYVTKVNGLEQVMSGVVLVLGSITGGGVAYYLGRDVSFMINGCSFLLAGTMIKGITFPTRSEKETPHVSKAHREAGNIVWSFLAIAAVASALDGIFNVLISLYAFDVFRLADLGIGIFYGLLGAGLASSAIFSKWFRGNFLFVVALFLIVEGVFQALLGLTDNFIMACLMFVFVALAGGIGNAAMDSAIMIQTPTAQLGKVFGRFSMVENGMMGMTMLHAGLLSESYYPTVIGWYGGIGNVALGFITLIVCVAYFFIKTRKYRDLC
ncbi:MFS transporter [Thalassobacillus hwangdonensis]|uniref:MFS transporter n=1 Tax=Thalassobacillus hwangdonensis TaxID=546108 RepID=A0ABW3KY87_9BACI